MLKKINKATINILRLEFLLRGNDYISVKRFSELLNVTERQIYRYLIEIKKQDTVNLSNEGDRYRIFEPSVGNNIKTSEELIEIYGAIQHNKLTELQIQILLKLVTQSDCLWVEKKPLEEKKNRQIISTIQRAIDNGTKVLLKGYHSRDKPPSDKFVTPVKLDKERNRLYALENGKRKCFNFENMIGKVELTRTKAEVYEAWEPMEDADPFGFMKPNDNRPFIEVQVALNAFAHSQLIRQFSVMKKYISDYSKKDKNYPFLLSIAVWDIQPIARFCVGLLHSVKIIGSEDAIKQIKDYADERIFKIGYKNNF